MDDVLKMRKDSQVSMSVNSSSSLNASSRPTYYVACLIYMDSSVIFVTYTLTNLLFLVPLYILVLYMGFQQWRRQPTASHSDLFTYHTVMMELVGAVGSLVYSVGIFTVSETLLLVGMFLFTVIFPGQTLFHLLTCVERYLAVVHPVTYIRLRDRGGVRIRNTSILCAWLLCFGWMGISGLYLPDHPSVPLVSMLGVSVVVISFCCFSVLRVLRHPGPGDGGRDTERVDQSKQRAFHIIVAIMGALLLRFVGLLSSFGVSFFGSVTQEDVCVLLTSGVFVTTPSSLVLPLLFLHKTGKLACCRHNTESG